MVEASSHRQLVVWQKAMDMAEGVYIAARKFPKFETYGLVTEVSKMLTAMRSKPAA